jgi:dTDP-4-amino-4,6-dideoxy-D-galactose acyltransferase
MTTTATQPARFLEWDSTFFARRIGAVINVPLSAEKVVDVVGWCRGERIECLYVLTDAEAVPTLHAVEDAGGRLVDVRLTLDLALSETPARPASTVRPHRASDVQALRTIAAASHGNSRFYADSHFPRARCNELYATWIEKSCRGWADQVFVAEVDGQPSGYLSCHVREGGRGEIGIVGVAGRAQGHGVGRDLVETAIHWLAGRGLQRATVVTQGRNIVAQRLYQTLGFRTAAVQVWHHLWFEVPSAFARERSDA